MQAASNVDPAELEKFESLAHRFWDPEGPFRTLHDIEPLRAAWVAERAPLAGRRVADIGCGGGLFAEGLARHGAQVTAIDLSATMIEVARLHATAAALSIDYRVSDVETLAAAQAARFDVVCCMEMVEHVPQPAELLAQLARLLRPGGVLFISTINRGARAFFGAIVAAEYLLGLVPKGTHEYAKLIRPAELAGHARAAGLALIDLTGLAYNPFTHVARLGVAPEINYLAQFQAAGAA
jgi:2-polyprenyl-6-hydroxyphenyl methylase/3-demethylubiquinone-9 3-methyltransferase